MPANADSNAETQVRRADQTSGDGCDGHSQVHAPMRRHETSGGRPPDDAHPIDTAPPRGEGRSARSRSPNSTEKNPSIRDEENARSRSPRDTSDVQRPPRHSVAGGRPPDPDGNGDASERSEPIQLQLDGAQLHRSHSFGFYRGVYWCWRCQGVASVMPRKLAHPCSIPSGSAYTDRSGGRVRQLSKKQLPSNMRQGWPLDEEARPRPDVLVQSQPT